MKRSVKKGALDASEFPALEQFLSGYLHQDFVLEHKTPQGALRAFLADAAREERDALFEELARFLTRSRGMAWNDVRQAFLALGSAWNPPSRAVLSALLHAHGPAASPGAQPRKRR